MDSKRQQIMNAVLARFEAILTTNGYETDMGRHAQLWKPDTFLDENLPEADIRDVNDLPDQRIGQEWHELAVEVRMAAHTVDEARQCFADCVKAVGVDRTWSGLAEETSAVSGGPVDIDTGEKVFTGALAKFTIEFTTDNMDAYQ